MRRYRDQETSTAQRKQATKRPKQAVRADASAESLRRQHAMARPREATPAVMFGLQQVIGNQALQRLIDESTRREQARAESGEMDAETGATIQRERGRGRPLDRTTAAQMGPALGDDYSGVRVHTDARADSLNRAMSAKAFTFGNDVFFSKNSYRPENPSGRHLLAHELTHVSQQHATMGSSRQAPLRLGPTNDRLEQEAERASTRVLTPSPAATTVGGSSLAQHSGLSTAPASVQRLEAKKSQQSTVKTAKQDDRPNLSFSDDRTIAINSARKEVSELYATQAVINAANVRLQTAGSDFELNVEGGTHITDGAHNNRLLKVVPHIKAHETTNAKSGYETRFCTHVSMEVARLIFSNMIASYHSGELFKLGYVDRYTTGRLRSTPVTRLVDIVS